MAPPTVQDLLPLALHSSTAVLQLHASLDREASLLTCRGFEQASLGHFTNGIQNVRSIKNNVVTLTTSGGNGTLFEPHCTLDDQVIRHS